MDRSDWRDAAADEWRVTTDEHRLLIDTSPGATSSHLPDSNRIAPLYFTVHIIQLANRDGLTTASSDQWPNQAIKLKNTFSPSCQNLFLLSIRAKPKYRFSKKSISIYILNFSQKQKYFNTVKTLFVDFPKNPIFVLMRHYFFHVSDEKMYRKKLVPQVTL